MSAGDYGGSERFEQRAPATASTRTKLKKFLLRYYPPGIILEYEHMGELMQRSVDLLDLSPDTDPEVLLNQIMRQESMIKPAHREPLRGLILKLQSKLANVASKDFALFKVLRAHMLPLTNCYFNKYGTKFITGSYDNTCKVFDTNTGEELLSLEGHSNVVYSMSFNNPYG